MKAGEKKLEDIPIIKYFPKVFPDDLTGLPPIRPVKFRIDLIPEATPIAKALYHLAPSEMQELSDQLKNSKTRDSFARVIHPGEHLKRKYTQSSQSVNSSWKKYVFLGHVVNKEGIHVEPEKIEAVKNWKAPSTLSKVIAYASLQIKVHEKNYTTHDLDSVQCLQHMFNQKELNMRQRWWIDLFSDYDYEIRYHHGKANVISDALSRKERVKPVRMRAMNMMICSDIKGKILEAQKEAFKEVNVQGEALWGLDKQMEHKEDDVMYIVGRIWVLLVGNVRTLVMDEAHKSRYSIHPGADKMYHDLRDVYWWPGMKRDITIYISKCLTCSKIKTDGQSKSIIQTLEDMIRTCIIDFGGSWDTHLPLAEFFHNNSYHTCIRCAPFEALYGRKCRSPVVWAEVGKSQMIGPEIVQETTYKIFQIKDRLKAARDRVPLEGCCAFWKEG
ncbi:putative reverse transcriptase domain-containing protein [Tanacetum coccineum]